MKQGVIIYMTSINQRSQKRVQIADKDKTSHYAAPYTRLYFSNDIRAGNFDNVILLFSSTIQQHPRLLNFLVKYNFCFEVFLSLFKKKFGHIIPGICQNLLFNKR